MNSEDREAIRRMLRERAADKTRTPELAREWLIEEGLYNANGELEPRYGGEDDKGRR